MDNAIKVGLLRDEYLLLQKFYEDFDGRIVTIKGWSATVGMAALGGGFYQSRFLWLFAAGAAVIFWLVEALWKSFQYMYAPRIQELETAFRSDHFDDVSPLQVYNSWFKQLHNHGFGVLSNARLGIVAFPHFVTVIAGVTLFLLHTFGFIHILAKT
jgi:hypothetical protein